MYTLSEWSLISADTRTSRAVNIRLDWVLIGLRRHPGSCPVALRRPAAFSVIRLTFF